MVLGGHGVPPYGRVSGRISQGGSPDPPRLGGKDVVMGSGRWYYSTARAKAPNPRRDAMSRATSALPAVLSAERIEEYLSRLIDAPARVVSVAPLQGESAEEIKSYGYGIPVLIDYEARGRTFRAVLETMAAGPFGHEHKADRAAAMVWENDVFPRLPRHVRSLDAGAILPEGLVSVGRAEEFFVLTEFASGAQYARDLDRIMQARRLSDLDRDRCATLAAYLAEIHAVRGPDPGLYVRRIRELVGHGECLMGLADSYPADFSAAPPALLEEIEHAAVRWRWRIKTRTDRPDRSTATSIRGTSSSARGRTSRFSIGRGASGESPRTT